MSYSEALEQSEQLERRSDENLVGFFAEELRRIGRGEPAAGLLPKNVVRRLVTIGLLCRRPGERGLRLVDGVKKQLNGA